MLFKPMKIILDTNIWISFVIGKRLSEVERILRHPDTEVFVSEALLQEVYATLLKPKLSQYVSDERRIALLKYMAACHKIPVTEKSMRSRDVNDNFLLDLAHAAGADFLISGDNDLLVLKRHFRTVIVSFNEFMAVFDSV